MLDDYLKVRGVGDVVAAGSALIVVATVAHYWGYALHAGIPVLAFFSAPDFLRLAAVFMPVVVAIGLLMSIAVEYAFYQDSEAAARKYLLEASPEQTVEELNKVIYNLKNKDYSKILIKEYELKLRKDDWKKMDEIYKKLDEYREDKITWFEKKIEGLKTQSVIAILITLLVPALYIFIIYAIEESLIATAIFSIVLTVVLIRIDYLDRGLKIILWVGVANIMYIAYQKKNNQFSYEEVITDPLLGSMVVGLFLYLALTLFIGEKFLPGNTDTYIKIVAILVTSLVVIVYSGFMLSYQSLNVESPSVAVYVTYNDDPIEGTILINLSNTLLLSKPDSRDYIAISQREIRSIERLDTD